MNLSVILHISLPFLAAPWLLVIDNVEIWDESNFYEYLPRGSQERSSLIIFTSRTPARHHDWLEPHVEVHPMSSKESVILLSHLLGLEYTDRAQAYTSERYTSAIQSIVSVCRGLPVGILEVKAQIFSLQVDPQEYLSILSKSGDDLLAVHRRSLPGQPDLLSQTFGSAVTRLSLMARHLALIIAYLDTYEKGVPLSYFHGVCWCHCPSCSDLSSERRYVPQA